MSLLRALSRARHRAVVNAAIYLGFSLCGASLGLLSTLVMVHHLVPAEYGRIGLFFSVLYIVAPLTSLAADGLVAVKKTVLDPAEYAQFQQSYVAIGYISFVLIQSMFIGGYLLGAYSDTLLAWAPLFALCRFFAGIASNEYIAEQRPVVFGALTLSSSALGLLLTFVLIDQFGDTAASRIAAMFMAEASLLVVRFWGRAGPLLRPRIDWNVVMQIVKFGLPSIVGVAGGWGLNEADKVVVAKVGGMDAAGFYTAAAGLAAVSLTFLQALTNALFPGLFSALSAEPHRARALLARYVSIFVVSTTLFAVLVILGYELLAAVLLPPRYLQVEGIFIALILSCIAVSVYRPFGLAADFFHLARTRAVAIIFGGGVSIGIEYLGMRQGDLMWVPAGIAAGYLTASAILVLGIHVAGVAKPSENP